MSENTPPKTSRIIDMKVQIPLKKISSTEKYSSSPYITFKDHLDVEKSACIESQLNQENETSRKNLTNLMGENFSDIDVEKIEKLIENDFKACSASIISKHNLGFDEHSIQNFSDQKNEKLSYDGFSSVEERDKYVKVYINKVLERINNDVRTSRIHKSMQNSSIKNSIVNFTDEELMMKSEICKNTDRN